MFGRTLTLTLTLTPTPTVTPTLTLTLALTLTTCLNRLYARLNGMQLTSKAEIDQLHVMSIFTKLFSKDLNFQGIE